MCVLGQRHVVRACERANAGDNDMMSAAGTGPPEEGRKGQMSPHHRIAYEFVARPDVVAENAPPAAVVVGNFTMRGSGGYRVTATLLCETALTMLAQQERGELARGFVTPSIAVVGTGVEGGAGAAAAGRDFVGRLRPHGVVWTVGRLSESGDDTDGGSRRSKI